MRVKRYLVDSMPDALHLIRSDLGSDAVILNTKEIRLGGFLGLFSKRKIEVIAATDTSEAPAPAAKARQERQPSLTTAFPSAATSSSVAVLDPPLKEVKKDKTAESSADAELRLPAAAQAAVLAQLGKSAYGSAARPAVSPESPAQSRETDDPILQELKVVRMMVQKLNSFTPDSMTRIDPTLQRLTERLLEQEIRMDLVDSIIGKIQEQSVQLEMPLTDEFVYHAARQLLQDILGSQSHKTLAPDTRIAHFVGPTGVGKTTTIAKLAAEQVLKYRRKVGLITSDTYRIAAVDQLKTYATILGLPLEVVFSPLDLKKAVEKFSDRDIIFMDTAGRNFRNEMYVSELNALLSSEGKSETYLVLSLTTKYKDMMATAENFAKFKLDKVLFTKRDETDTFGPIFNLLHDYPLGLSYITTGQNVPDDFSVVSESELLDLVLGEHADE